jgi:NAD(P)-dependent dehydrogenase (short-subunit alcohol dehydrogenase family)
MIVASDGFVERVLTLNATPAQFDKTFGINARGVYFIVRKALPLMRNGGVIIFVSSLHLKALPEHATYAAAKAAIRSFVRTWAMELKDRGIRVNTLSLRAVDTPIIDGRGRRRQGILLRDSAPRSYWPARRDGVGNSVPRFGRE